MTDTYSSEDDKARSEAIKKETAHAWEIGSLCMAWAALDRIIDDLFEPLLQCSAAQVACIITNVDNIATRCEMLKRLIHLESVGGSWRDWFVAVLQRVSGEIAPLRNRHVHDQWVVHVDKLVRTDKRAKISQAQARHPPKVTFDTQHVTAPDEVRKLTHRIHAVLAALSFAEHDLRVWRRRGVPVLPDPRLLPVSKPNARYRTPQEHLEAIAHKKPLEDYVFD